MEGIIFEIVKAVASGVVLAIVLWASKLPKSLRANTEGLKDNTEALKRVDVKVDDLHETVRSNGVQIDLSHKRHDVTDVVLSSILKDSFSSSGIALNKTDWPRIFEDHSSSTKKES